MDVASILVGWLALASLVALVLCIADKSAARRGASRVPERALLGTALVGGTPGLVLGMLLARHKTRKLAFLAPLALIVALQVGLFLWLAR